MSLLFLSSSISTSYISQSQPYRVYEKRLRSKRSELRKEEESYPLRDHYRVWFYCFCNGSPLNYPQRRSHNGPVSNSYYATHVFEIFWWLPSSRRIKAKFFTSIGPQKLLARHVLSSLTLKLPTPPLIQSAFFIWTFLPFFPYNIHCHLSPFVLAVLSA